MNCYLVTENTIKAVVIRGMQAEKELDKELFYAYKNCLQIWEANIAAVKERYPDDPTMWDVTEKLEITQEDVSNCQDLSFVELIKLCHCINYQCCDWNKWEESRAYVTLFTYIYRFESSLPGYEEAPWGLPGAPEYTIVLMYPDYLADEYGKETYTGIGCGDTPAEAVEIVQKQASQANDDSPPEDFAVIAVIKGRHELEAV